MQHSHDQKHNSVNDCCYQQWPSHHHHHHHHHQHQHQHQHQQQSLPPQQQQQQQPQQQLAAIPSPMQQMEGEIILFHQTSNNSVLIILFINKFITQRVKM